jgi:lysophospholipase L1-like esterase
LVGSALKGNSKLETRNSKQIRMPGRICVLAILLSCVGLSARADFAIRDGDTVVFLGDSITAARTYGKIIENYTLLRFPDRKVRFINAGHGGETAKGSLQRLDQAVFAKGATVLTVAYGINDIGWGVRADEAHKQEYLAAVGQIVERCKEHGVRVYICSAAITAEDPERAEKGFLQTMCDEGMALAKAKGGGAIDVQRLMRQVQRRVIASNAKEPDKAKHTKIHVDDGIHLNDLGQMAMAYAILKGLGAPADVSSATLDAKNSTAVASEGCEITEIKNTGSEISFVRQDHHLPLNLQPLWMLQGMFVPISDELNRYMLTVKNLPAGRYEISAGGRLLGAWNANEIDRGINVASATPDPWQPGGPWDAQGHAVKIFTDMRDELTQAQRGMADDLKAHPHLNELQKQTTNLESEIVGLQRTAAQPVPVRFVIRAAAK